MSRRIELISKMVSKSNSILKRIGVEDTNDSMCAVRLYGIVFAQELVHAHGVEKSRARQLEQAMIPASRRASARLKACSGLLSKIASTNSSLGFYVSSDPIYIATEPGRDMMIALELIDCSIVFGFRSTPLTSVETSRLVKLA
jgi:hypothetical protein